VKFSIINVDRVRENGNVGGGWIQNHMGTPETARELVKSLEAVNRGRDGNGTKFAIIDEIPCPVAILGYWTDRKVVA